MKHKLFLWLALLAAASAFSLFAIGQRSEAVIDGDAKADAYQVITFPNITSADTLEVVKLSPLHTMVEIFLIIESRRHGGFAAGDSVQVVVSKSPNDSSYTNISDGAARYTYTTAGQKSITYRDAQTARYLRVEIPNMDAADSLRVRAKMVITPRVR